MHLAPRPTFNEAKTRIVPNSLTAPRSRFIHVLSTLYYDHDHDCANDYDNEIKNHIVPQFDCFYTLWMTLMFIMTAIMIMTI